MHNALSLKKKNEKGKNALPSNPVKYSLLDLNPWGCWSCLSEPLSTQGLLGPLLGRVPLVLRPVYMSV